MGPGSTLTKNERRAYILLSEFFLDTEVDTSQHAEALRSLNIPIDILYNMLCCDLFPVLYGNIIYLVTPLWLGFDTALDVFRGRSSKESLWLGLGPAHACMAYMWMIQWNETREKSGETEEVLGFAIGSYLSSLYLSDFVLIVITSCIIDPSSSPFSCSLFSPYTPSNVTGEKRFVLSI